jgi:hypothetical protein
MGAIEQFFVFRRQLDHEGSIAFAAPKSIARQDYFPLRLIGPGHGAETL